MDLRQRASLSQLLICVIITSVSQEVDSGGFAQGPQGIYLVQGLQLHHSEIQMYYRIQIILLNIKKTFAIFYADCQLSSTYGRPFQYPDFCLQFSIKRFAAKVISQEHCIRLILNTLFSFIYCKSPQIRSSVMSFWLKEIPNEQYGSIN